MEFTIEIYKSDKRRKDGKRFIEAVEIEAKDRNEVDIRARELTMKDVKLSFEIHETYREVRNIMSGKIVKEHYKTPYYLSVGSETYFSM